MSRYPANVLAAARAAHQANLDAGYREIDRRQAEGEDMRRAYVCKKTYAIKFQSKAAFERAQLRSAERTYQAQYAYACGYYD